MRGGLYTKPEVCVQKSPDLLPALMCPQPVWQDPQETLAPLPSGPPVVTDSLAAGAAELTDPALLPFGRAFHVGGKDSSWSRMKSQLKVLKSFSYSRRESSGHAAELVLCSIGQVVYRCPPQQGKVREELDFFPYFCGLFSLKKNQINKLN